MSYVFHNMSDERLAALALAVHEERTRRFLAVAYKHPKLAGIDANSGVDGVKAYRDAYTLSVTAAHMLFNFYHR